MQTRIRGTSRCCGGSFAKQVAGKVEKGETATLLRERLEIRLDENLHGLFAGINLDPKGRVANVDLVRAPNGIPQHPRGAAVMIGWCRVGRESAA